MNAFTPIASVAAQGPSVIVGVQTAVMRLILTPARQPGHFTALIETEVISGEKIMADATVVTATTQPLVDGARILLERGFDPAALLTLRHAGKSYDSFQPLPISAWARWTYTEGEATPLRRQAWKPRQMPIAAVTQGQKSGSMAATDIGGRPGDFVPAPLGGGVAAEAAATILDGTMSQTEMDIITGSTGAITTPVAGGLTAETDVARASDLFPALGRSRPAITTADITVSTMVGADGKGAELPDHRRNR